MRRCGPLQATADSVRATMCAASWSREDRAADERCLMSARVGLASDATPACSVLHVLKRCWHHPHSSKRRSLLAGSMLGAVM